MIVSGHTNSCWGTNVPGHKLNVSGHKRVWAQSCLGTKRVWVQTCVGTIVCGHNRVWVQACVGTTVSGHNRVWSQTYVGTVVWAQSCRPNHVWAQTWWNHSNGPFRLGATHGRQAPHHPSGNSHVRFRRASSD